MIRRLLAIVLVATAVATWSTAYAGLAPVFSDRDDWRQAASGALGLPAQSGDLFEDFNSVDADLNYGGGVPRTVGFLTLSTNSASASAIFIIDAPPFEFPDIAVGDTTFAVAGVSPSVRTFLSFTDVVALGFDYGPAMPPGFMTLETSTGARQVVDLQSDGGFIGLLSDPSAETFTSLEFIGIDAQQFTGIDDVEAFTPVPLPAALWLLGSCAAALGGLRYRSR